jgi:hypothetical protein
MPDLDDLLSPDLARAAAGAARPPELRSLLERGARRRRVRRTAIVGGAAPVSYKHLPAHETTLPLGCRLML